MTSDEAFVEQAFLEVLGRPLDPVGRRHFLEQLERGATRRDIVATLEASEERTHAAEPRPLPDIRAENPQRFTVLPRLGGEGRMAAFVAEHDEDLVWMEQQILRHGYYEAPGVWTFAVDVDKKVMAEAVTRLEPASVLELGCSSGALLHVLHGWGVEVTGVEVSRLAVEHAPSTVADKVHLGDLESLPPMSPVDVGVALDVFEHLRPDAVPEVLGQMADRVRPDGLLMVNVPVFGKDKVFGRVFPMDVQEWVDDARAGRWFRHLPVDPLGFPTHGHLVWAAPDWWERQFADAGLRRLPDVERALHHVYGRHWKECTPARQTLFVLTRSSGGMGRRAARDMAYRIRQHGSAILESLGEEPPPDRLERAKEAWRGVVPAWLRSGLARARHLLAGRRVP